MPICTKCTNDITNSSTSLLCAECKGTYHLECTRFGNVDSLKKLTARQKTAWKCDTCSAETSSSASHDSRGDAKPSLSTLMEAFQTMGKNLSSQMADLKTSVDGIQLQLQGVTDTISVMKETLNVLVTENEERKTECSQLKVENNKLREDIANLQQQVRDIEQYSRRDNIEIVGVPLSRGEVVYSILNQMSKVLNIQQFNQRGISVAHRLPKRDNQAHPNIIVKFVCREDKKAWMRAAREHRGKLTAASLSDSWPSTSIFINDHLTPHNKMILGRAKHLVKEKKLAFAWSRDCKVFAKKTSLPDCPATLLHTLQDLDQLVKQV